MCVVQAQPAAASLLDVIAPGMVMSMVHKFEALSTVWQLPAVQPPRPSPQCHQRWFATGATPGTVPIHQQQPCSSEDLVPASAVGGTNLGSQHLGGCGPVLEQCVTCGVVPIGACGDIVNRRQQHRLAQLPGLAFIGPQPACVLAPRLLVAVVCILCGPSSFDELDGSNGRIPGVT